MSGSSSALLQAGRLLERTHIWKRNLLQVGTARWREDDARSIVHTSHDNLGAGLEWCFVEERPDDWSPFLPISPY